jgi:hypothetical protein
MIHNNSIDAYTEEAPRLSAREQEVYSFCKHNKGRSYTVKRLSELMGFGHHSAIQPRVSDLLRKGLLEEAVDTKCEHTGKTCAQVRFKDKDDRQIEMF